MKIVTLFLYETAEQKALKYLSVNSVAMSQRDFTDMRKDCIQKGGVVLVGFKGSSGLSGLFGLFGLSGLFGLFGPSGFVEFV